MLSPSLYRYFSVPLSVFFFLSFFLFFFFSLSLSLSLALSLSLSLHRSVSFAKTFGLSVILCFFLFVFLGVSHLCLLFVAVLLRLSVCWSVFLSCLSVACFPFFSCTLCFCVSLTCLCFPFTFSLLSSSSFILTPCSSSAFIVDIVALFSCSFWLCFSFSCPLIFSWLFMFDSLALFFWLECVLAFCRKLCWGVRRTLMLRQPGFERGVWQAPSLYNFWGFGSLCLCIKIVETPRKLALSFLLVGKVLMKSVYKLYAVNWSTYDINSRSAKPSVVYNSSFPPVCVFWGAAWLNLEQVFCAKERVCQELTLHRRVLNRTTFCSQARVHTWTQGKAEAPKTNL